MTEYAILFLVHIAISKIYTKIFLCAQRTGSILAATRSTLPHSSSRNCHGECVNRFRFVCLFIFRKINMLVSMVGNIRDNKFIHRFGHTMDLNCMSNCYIDAMRWFFFSYSCHLMWGMKNIYRLFQCGRFTVTSLILMSFIYKRRELEKNVTDVAFDGEHWAVNTKHSSSPYVVDRRLLLHRTQSYLYLSNPHTICLQDYYPDLIANDSIAFLRQSKQQNQRKPIMLTMSFPSPHGPEDSAPQYSHLFFNVTTHQ